MYRSSRRGLSLVPYIEFYVRDLNYSADHSAIFVCVFFSQPRCYFRENQEQSLKRGGRLCGGLNFWLQSLIFVLRTATHRSLEVSFYLSEFHKKCLRVR